MAAASGDEYAMESKLVDEGKVRSKSRPSERRSEQEGLNRKLTENLVFQLRSGPPSGLGSRPYAREPEGRTLSGSVSEHAYPPVRWGPASRQCETFRAYALGAAGVEGER